MGIHKFLSTLKKYNNKINNKFISNIPTIKYDYILIDCFSLFYNSKKVIQLYNDFNKKYNNSNIQNIIYNQENLKEFIFYVLSLKNLINYNSNKLCNNFNKDDTYDIIFQQIISYIHKIILDDKQVFNFILYDTYSNILDIIDKNKKDDNTKIIIFFDNIPTVAKIQEQINRQIYNRIDTILFLNDGIHKNDGFNIKNIEDNVIVTSGSKIVIELEKLITEKHKNIEINNSLNKGEAEHEIYYYIVNEIYIKNINNKNILFVSPDSDSIILSTILKYHNLNNNNNIDILNVMTYGNYNEYKYNNDDNNIKINNNNFTYIFINKFIDSININKSNIYNNYFILDIMFLSMFLGNDFIPKLYFCNDFYNLVKIYYKFYKDNIVKFDNNKYIIDFVQLKLFFKYIGNDNTIRINKKNKQVISDTIEANNIYNIIKHSIQNYNDNDKNNLILNFKKYSNNIFNHNIKTIIIIRYNNTNYNNIVYYNFININKDNHDIFNNIKFIEISNTSKKNFFNIDKLINNNISYPFDKYKLLKEKNIIIYVSFDNNKIYINFLHLTHRSISDIYMFNYIKNDNYNTITLNNNRLKYIFDFNDNQTDDLIQNYIDGMIFTFELYFNNIITNQYYYYKYKFTPSCYLLYNYFQNNSNYEYKINEYKQYNNFDKKKNYIDLKLDEILVNISKNICNKYKLNYSNNVEDYIKYEFLDNIIYSIHNYLEKSVIYNIDLSNFKNIINQSGGNKDNNDYYNILSYIIKLFTKS